MDVIYLLAKYLASPIENAIIMYFLIRNFGFKDGAVWKRCFTVLSFIIVVLIAQLTVLVPNGYILIPIVVIIVYWIYCRITLHGRSIMQLLCCFTVFLIMILVNAFVYQIVSMTMGVSVDSLIHNEKFVKVWLFILSKLVLFVCIEVLLHILKRNQLNLRKGEWFTLIIVFSVSFAISVSIYTLITAYPDDKISNIELIVILIGIFILNIYIYHSILKMSRDNQKILESELADLQRHEMATQLLQISEAESNEARLLHDYKNHLICIQELLQTSRYDDAGKYIENITESYQNKAVSEKICNNAVINAVVNSKIRTCRKRGIRWEHDVTGDTSRLDGVTCSIVLFNLLDNAIEAYEGTENKDISLSMYYNKNYFNIVVKNYIDKSVLDINPQLSSSKKKGRHGLGHLNVQEVVEKNGGMVEYYEKNNQFIAHVMLKV